MQDIGGFSHMLSLCNFHKISHLSNFHYTHPILHAQNASTLSYLNIVAIKYLILILNY
ncbi:hypothetical protein PghCCS26_10860 [Paenibacillus glycanilyticus]|uniref:Uncharacterized protein n=1 Tax=Paenibacillus glycanilyticus TaxID=126569 RepID=A0ABQ6NGR9_9BACL|nr:hypothetical protein PghCCS26_10860 [Paenibacillus glycanilyticus]